MSLFNRRNNPIGSMFTGGGMTPGQTIGRAYADFGKTIGTTALDAANRLQRRADEREQQRLSEEGRKVLEQYTGNPEGLLAKGQELSVSRDPKVAEMGQRFVQIAQARITQQTAADDKETAELQRQGELRLMDLARTMGAQNKDIMNNDLQRRAYLNVAAGFKVSPARAMEIAKNAMVKPETITIGQNERVGRINEDGQFEEIATGVGEAPEQGRFKSVKMEDGSVMLFNDLTGLNQIIPADVKDQGASFALIQRTAGYINDVDKLLGVDPKDMTRQIREPGFTESGLYAQLFSRFGGFAARDRQRLIDEIRARLGFEQIAEMKKQAEESGASGTGLGQISNIEFNSLQSTVAALDVSMSAEAQVNALIKIRKHLENIQRTASGITAEQTIDWNTPKYKASGYSKDPKSGKVFYAPDGPDGQKFYLDNGKFVPVPVGG